MIEAVTATGQSARLSVSDSAGAIVIGVDDVAASLGMRRSFMASQPNRNVRFLRHLRSSSLYERSRTAAIADCRGSYAARSRAAYRPWREPYRPVHGLQISHWPA